MPTVLTVFSKSLEMKAQWDCIEVSHTLQGILVSPWHSGFSLAHFIELT